LYISHACPWCHRTTILRALKGLQKTITVDVLDPVRRGGGWEFAPEREGCTRDSLFGHEYLRDIYTEADPEFTGRPTAPVLYDRHEDTIVNNESAEIMRMLDVAFDGVAGTDVSLYPEDYRDRVDKLLERIYEPINNGVTKVGFADTQAAYDRAVGNLFDALDHWDSILTEQRYLAGEVPTEADVAMFATLYRFDEGYHTNFKCNKRRIVDYQNLWSYVKELYQLPGVKDTCHMDHVKATFYQSDGHKNPDGIVPVGPDPHFGGPHDRDLLTGGPPEELT